MRSYPFHKLLVLLALCWVLLPARELPACSVPVFRYALEWWQPDCYDAVAYHRGSLADDDRAALDVLEKIAADAKRPANLGVWSVDLSADPAPELLALYQSQAPAALPCVVLRYARMKEGGAVVWWGPLGREAASKIVDSPARREIARRLLSGDTAVWVLVESGDQQKDDAAAEGLEKLLQRIEKGLKPLVPMAETSPMTTQADQLPGEGTVHSADPPVPLKLGFSMVRVSRADAAEEVFLQMLLRSESDLHEYADQPIAFPVFGRGRVLYALVGRGINEANVGEACGFLVGPCSCQFKVENPGTDLLMAVDWERAVAGQLAVEEALPPLTGVMPQPIAQAETEGTPGGIAGGAQPPQASARLVSRAMFVIAAAVVAAALGTILMLLGGKKNAA